MTEIVTVIRRSLIMYTLRIRPILTLWSSDWAVYSRFFLTEDYYFKSRRVVSR